MPPHSHASTLRIATWNILSDDYRRSERLAHITTYLKAINADVILLQEAWSQASEIIARELGYHLAGETSGTYTNAVITASPPTQESVVNTLRGLTSQGEPIQSVQASITSRTGRVWHATSAHLSWGGAAEYDRLQQAVELENLARAQEALTPQSTIVLGGDFNCTPDSSALAYLTGKMPHETSSTYWVDAWDKAGTGDGATSDPSNPLAQRIANLVGILDPTLLPKRRIDYVLVRGYAHGRPGCPLLCQVTQVPNASDHGVVVAELWDPPLQSSH